jgi:hypothetical protein
VGVPVDAVDGASVGDDWGSAFFDPLAAAASKATTPCGAAAEELSVADDAGEVSEAGVVWLVGDGPSLVAAAEFADADSLDCGPAAVFFVVPGPDGF